MLHCSKWFQSPLTPTHPEIPTMLTAEQVLAAQKANLQTLFGLTGTRLEGDERLVNRTRQSSKAA